MKYILDISDDIGECKTAVVSGSGGMCFVNMTKLIAEERTGRWIKADTHNYLLFKNDRIYKCSNCGRLLDFEGVNGGRGDANFCPNCGAKMKGEEE